ncbi:hypothetical protein C8T65DRAFT_545737, partial [Cerioporus squamosus]
PVTPQCTKCLRWGHVRGNCNAVDEFCARCGERHRANFHNIKAKCCQHRPDRNTVPCEHPPWCLNCGGTHYATDRVLCEFAKHRNDREWYK